LVREWDDCCEIHQINKEATEKARKNMIDPHLAQSLAELFKTLGDTTRVKILCALMTGELCVCDIASVVGLSESAISHQLRILRNHRLVKYRRDGKIVYYSLADSHVESLFGQGMEHAQE